MAKRLWNAVYRWCFSCGYQSMEALWLEFREITFYHYNLSISSKMAVHLRNNVVFQNCHHIVHLHMP